MKVARYWAKILRRNLGFNAREESKIVAQHNQSVHFDNLRSTDGAKRYILSYALKPKQKTVPKDFQDVGRWWGASRVVRESVPPGVEIDISEMELRRMVKDNGFDHEKWQVLPRVIWRRT